MDFRYALIATIVDQSCQTVEHVGHAQTHYDGDKYREKLKLIDVL